MNINVRCAKDLSGVDLPAAITVDHDLFDRFKHVNLVKIEHRPSGVVRECITTLTFLNAAGAAQSRIVIPGTTRVTVFDE